MASTARDIFVVGLRNAHSMEVQARELMERQSERLTDYPEDQAKVRAHLRQTEGQLNRLEQCLSSMGESPSTLKDTAQSVMGNIMALGHSMAGDEILKNTFANNAFEHFEIAAYKSLLTLCGPAGADSSRAMLEQSLKEEEAMAAWVDENVPRVTLASLGRECAQGDACLPGTGTCGRLTGEVPHVDRRGPSPCPDQDQQPEPELRPAYRAGRSVTAIFSR